MFPITPMLVALWLHDANCAAEKTIAAIEVARRASLHVWDKNEDGIKDTLTSDVFVKAVRAVQEDSRWYPRTDRCVLPSILRRACKADSDAGIYSEFESTSKIG